ncbi:hypothetical protein CLOM_g13875 [Closterium sp. NIES-68]|nr:hypothetical protein CLOM_g13875 [Closterium sp. NIES-68]GJP71022.1 hypothetical protein CLOP_g1902 [Closterium sp. NIES-67]
MASVRENDQLDKLVVFLAKRDGIDKLVKTFQYVFKLAHWQLSRTNKDLADRAQKFEIGCGLSRKAFRLGRFLTGFNNLRTTEFSDWKVTTLSVVGSAGEMVYFFFDHLTWMSKVGLLDPKLAAKTAYISAYGESVLYLCFISLDIIMIKRGMEQEKQLQAKLQELHQRAETLALTAKNSPRHGKSSGDDGTDSSTCAFSNDASRRSSFESHDCGKSNSSQGSEGENGWLAAAAPEGKTAPAAAVAGGGLGSHNLPLLCTCKEACIEELRKLEGEAMKIKIALSSIRMERLMRVLSIAGQFGDLLISVSQVEPNPVCCHPLTLGLSGLLSAWTGWYRVWPAK